MLVAPRPSLSAAALDQPVHREPVVFVELGSPSDAVEPFKQLILRSHASDLRLSCTVPTWSSSSDHCLDLHDLHQLRTRALVFIHDIIQALRSAGVNASYVLVPSNSSRCVIFAGRYNELASALSILQKAPLKKEHQVLLADVGSPCIVVT